MHRALLRLPYDGVFDNEPREAESICLDALEREPDNQEALKTLLLALTDQFRKEEARAIRAAEPESSTKTGWRVNAWVKKGILVGFRMGVTVDMSINTARQPWFDKATFPLQRITFL